MAGLSLDRKSGIYRIQFRFGGRHFTKSLKTKKEKDAEAQRVRVEETLRDLERGRLVLPAGADFWEFVKTDGKRDQKPQLPTVMTVGDLFDWYFANQTPGAKESKTIKTETIHANHVKRLLGTQRALHVITGQVLQEEYVNQRAKEDWYGMPILPDTIQKEVATLQMVWNRAFRQRVRNLHCECPAAGLKYPKKREKPPFQTWDEIEGIIARGGLTDAEVRQFWDCLFLEVGQVQDVLEHVRSRKTRRTYFHPLLVCVAHTGARLSECLRSQVEDFMFDAGKVRLREKKKDQASETYRFVNMSTKLRQIMEGWFRNGHPGGKFSFCRIENKKFHDQTLHDDFEWFMTGSKWQVLRGFHVFRHSFASNLALQGTDQRVIDDLMGHQTEAMRKRYRHLFPKQKQSAIEQLFG